jgi:hypothetical protein
MNTLAPLVGTLIGAIGTIFGYFVSNLLERNRALRLRELEFRLDRYKEFLLAFSELSANKTYQTQLRFVNSVNVILLIGSANLLKAVKDLVDNYNDENASAEKQTPILNRIMLGMRRDLNDAESKHLAEFEFPLIVPDPDLVPSAKAPSAEINLPNQ